MLIKDGKQKNIEHKIGTNKYAMTEYDKLKGISIPLDEKYLLMIATEIETNHTKVIKKNPRSNIQIFRVLN